MIHEYQAPRMFGPDLVRADERFLHGKRPDHNDGGFTIQVLQQFGSDIDAIWLDVLLAA